MRLRDKTEIVSHSSPPAPRSVGILETFKGSRLLANHRVIRPGNLPLVLAASADFIEDKRIAASSSRQSVAHEPRTYSPFVTPRNISSSEEVESRNETAL